MVFGDTDMGGSNGGGDGGPVPRKLSAFLTLCLWVVHGNT